MQNANIKFILTLFFNTSYYKYSINGNRVLIEKFTPSPLINNCHINLKKWNPDVKPHYTHSHLHIHIWTNYAIISCYNNYAIAIMTLKSINLLLVMHRTHMHQTQKCINIQHLHPWCFFRSKYVFAWEANSLKKLSRQKKHEMWHRNQIIKAIKVFEGQTLHKVE